MKRGLHRTLGLRWLVGLAAAAPLTPSSCDVEVALAVDDPSPAPGQEVEVDVAVTNQEPVEVSDVTVEVELPRPRVEVVEARPSHGTFSEDDGIWEVGDLASGKEARLDIMARVRELDPGEEP